MPLRVRSMVGLIPLFAVEVLDASVFARLPEFCRRGCIGFSTTGRSWRGWSRAGTTRATGERHLLSLLRGHRMKRLLRRMLDETEFLSDYGVRSLSKFHEKHPLRVRARRQPDSASITCRANATLGVFGGNSNWRGPIWMPVNFLLIESLQRFHSYYGDDFQVECPVGSGNLLHLGEVGGRAGAPAVPAVSARRERAAAGLRRLADRCRTIRISATICCFTNISTATPARVSAPRTRPAGPRWSRCCCGTIPTRPRRRLAAPPRPVEAALPEPAGAR